MEPPPLGVPPPRLIPPVVGPPQSGAPACPAHQLHGGGLFLLIPWCGPLPFSTSIGECQRFSSLPRAPSTAPPPQFV